MGRVPVSVGIRVPFFAPSSAVSYYVYILYSASHDKYYIGQTNDVGQRLKRHNNGLEKFTSPYSPWISKCVIEKTTRGEAMILEKKLKNLNRQKLQKFIEKYSPVSWGRDAPEHSGLSVGIQLPSSAL